MDVLVVYYVQCVRSGRVSSMHQDTEEALFFVGRVAHFKCQSKDSETLLEFLIWKVSSIAAEQIAELQLGSLLVTFAR